MRDLIDWECTWNLDQLQYPIELLNTQAHHMCGAQNCVMMTSNGKGMKCEMKCPRRNWRDEDESCVCERVQRCNRLQFCKIINQTHRYAEKEMNIDKVTFYVITPESANNFHLKAFFFCSALLPLCPNCFLCFLYFSSLCQSVVRVFSIHSKGHQRREKLNRRSERERVAAREEKKQSKKSKKKFGRKFM